MFPLFLTFWIWIIHHSTFRFLFCHFQHLCYSSCLDGMLCVYNGNDKKEKFTNLKLKEIRHEAEKELEHLFSSLSNTQWWLFFCLFEIETWKPVYPMMLKCNVCIAQCLLVGYYKSSDQSNKVVQFSTTKTMCRSLIDFPFIFDYCDFLVS